MSDVNGPVRIRMEGGLTSGVPLVIIQFPAVGGGSDGYGGPVPDDPLTVYIVRMEDSDDVIERKVSLNDVLQDSLEECLTTGGFSSGLGRIAVALRQLADKIDGVRAAAIARFGAEKE